MRISGYLTDPDPAADRNEKAEMDDKEKSADIYTDDDGLTTRDEDGLTTRDEDDSTTRGSQMKVHSDQQKRKHPQQNTVHPHSKIRVPGARKSISSEGTKKNKIDHIPHLGYRLANYLGDITDDDLFSDKKIYRLYVLGKTLHELENLTPPGDLHDELSAFRQKVRRLRTLLQAIKDEKSKATKKSQKSNAVSRMPCYTWICYYY